MSKLKELIKLLEEMDKQQINQGKIRHDQNFHFMCGYIFGDEANNKKDVERLYNFILGRKKKIKPK